MLTHEQIVKAVEKAATKFPLTKISYFGSYADGKATVTRGCETYEQANSK
jgi:hypothetical protein